MPVKVTNATATYAIMILLFIAGMWMILSYGSTLRPQPDIAGEWELRPEGNGPPDRKIRAVVEQSGRFVRLRIGDRPPLDLQMLNEPGSAETESRRPRIELAGPDLTVTLDREPAPDHYILTMRSPRGTERYSAAIIARTYQRASSTVRGAGNKGASDPTFMPATSPTRFNTNAP